jgi:serine/threonine-protein kinase
MQAYYLDLQGRQWQIRYTPQAVARAIGFFERAIERDPDFALAHASLAMLHVQMAEDGAVPPAAALERARTSVTTALRLDPDLDAAQCTLGHLRQMSDFDWAGAEQAFRRALDLNPSNADACNLYGRLCASLGRYDEAVALHERAQVLDPLAHRLDVATTLLRAGRFDEAVQRAQLATELDQDYDRARATLGWAYILSGRVAEGVAELERAVAIGSGRTLWLGQLGQAYALAGDEAKARAVLRELEERSRDGYVSSYHFAYVYAGLGDAERALDWLERAVAERTGAVHGVRGSFLFASLQEHPRFRALLRRINLV